ncbi:coiled-coil domain-containing protein 122 [Candoia aspera]|uniref:coiled-coil domain-containing protein 122 n=1 Tax=Candoia aspera TaxID=51853 RepID=UPI002FD7C3FF
MADSDPSGITEMVKRVAEQQNTQASEIQRSKEVLTRLQAQLQDLEAQRNSVLSERKAIERQRYFCEEAIATTKCHCEDLEVQVATLYVENTKLTQDTEVLQEEFKMVLSGNRAYYEKIAAHQNRFEEEESKLPFAVELMEKRGTLQQMMMQKEELMASLQKAEEHDTVGQVQDEIACLQSEIKVLKEAVSEKEKAIQDEKSTHAMLQKEIELQNKRCEAILKRLRCQINKVESDKRQGHWKMQQLEEKLEALRKHLQATD